MLYLIGTGLFYLNDLPLRAVDVLKSADKVFLERYTNVTDVSYLGELEKIIGKKIEILERQKVEDEYLVKLATGSKVCLLIPGDPLAATTHLSLLVSCKSKGIKTDVIHASSIFSAVAETGLSLYKFGMTVSIPIYEENFAPDSFFDGIDENLKMGLHTLVLLEARSEEIFLGVNDAVEILKKIENKREKKAIDWSKVLYVSRLGSENCKIGVAEHAPNDLKPPISLVIPGKLNKVEEETIKEIIK